MNTCKNFVDSIKNADFTGIFRLIMKEPSYIKLPNRNSNYTIYSIPFYTVVLNANIFS